MTEVMKEKLNPFHTPSMRSTEESITNQNSFRVLSILYITNFCETKFNQRSTRTRCEICSKLTIKTPERRHWRRSDVFIVNFEHISHLVLVFLSLTLNI